MPGYDDILKAADPNCCHRKKVLPPELVAIENLVLTLFFGSIYVAIKLSGNGPATMAAGLMTLYMAASSANYMFLMTVYKPTTHLNDTEEDEQENSDEEEEGESQEGEEEEGESQEGEEEEGEGQEGEDDYKDLPALVSNDDTDDEMPPLIPLDLQDNKVLRQLKQVVDETNARNQARVTRSVLAKAYAAARAADATLTATDPEIKKIN